MAVKRLDKIYEIQRTDRRTDGRCQS